MLNLAVTIVFSLQQGIVASPGFTSPPNGDTTGYWQQRVHYTIVATLDERAQKVRARGTLVYVNNSPDTLREMFVHQYLNAFRPASKWSQVDEREGRDRFQRLEEPDYAYERFTAPVRVNDAEVRVEYPGAPDSTVARFPLPRPLVPGDSVRVSFEWDARPSTLPRRQGRRGRHWDLAQWYPKVAVYDRGGWQHNALQPAGEFYGEFGTYDVSLVVANDQVVGSTGVPVSGDPGWRRVIRAGGIRTASAAYRDVPDASAVSPPAGHRVVRFFARDVHHFAWTASPDYRYEGGGIVRETRARFPTWDTVSVHVLYRPGDDTTWGGQRVLQRTYAAIQWLENLYGPYAYPQMTVLHRLDGGGTEFPMMQMNGSASQGLILHEGGHIWTYGILADNEWRSGWMDEGLTSYQTAWAQSLTPLERQKQNITAGAPDNARGYRRRAARMLLPRFEVVNVDMARMDLEGRAEPIGTVAHEFRDFATYNDMIYDRAEVMYGQLRDVLGDSAFASFLRDYYARWALRHVDERAMRASAQRVSGRDLGWFFDQWVHRTGVMDYRLRRVRTRREGSGWVTEATIRRVGDYAHPMTVGVRTDSGWTIGRMTQEPYREEVVRVVTSLEPREVRLDPYHVTWDWDRRNDRRWGFWSGGAVKYVFDWPFLDQTDRERRVLRYRPTAWYSDPGGAVIGVSERGNYLGFADRLRLDLGFATRAQGRSTAQGYMSYATGRNPHLRVAGGWVDDLAVSEVGWRWLREAGVRSREVDLALHGARPARRLDAELIPELWPRDTNHLDLALRARWHRGSVDDSYWFARPTLVAGMAYDSSAGGFGKAELSIGRVENIGEHGRAAVRAYYASTFGDTPGPRALYLSSQDPVSTLSNHWWRPRGAILKRPNVNWLPLGGAALRGAHWTASAERVGAVNAELGRRVAKLGSRADTAGIWINAFADAAAVPGNDVLYDAGPGIAIRGKLFDLPLNLRFDFPLLMSETSIAIDRGHAGRSAFAPRWAITFNDIW